RTIRHIEAVQWENLDIEERYASRGATILRLGAVYGEHDHQRRLDFVLRRVRAGRRRLPIGAGTWLFSRVYVGDVATAVERALLRGRPRLASGGVLTVLESRAE